MWRQPRRDGILTADLHPDMRQRVDGAVIADRRRRRRRRLAGRGLSASATRARPRPAPRRSAATEPARAPGAAAVSGRGRGCSKRAPPGAAACGARIIPLWLALRARSRRGRHLVGDLGLAAAAARARPGSRRARWASGPASLRCVPAPGWACGRRRRRVRRSSSAVSHSVSRGVEEPVIVGRHGTSHYVVHVGARGWASSAIRPARPPACSVRVMRTSR